MSEHSSRKGEQEIKSASGVLIALLILTPICAVAITDVGAGVRPAPKSSDENFEPSPTWTEVSGTLPSTNGYYNMAFSDFNGDGDMDVTCVIGSGPAGALVYTGDGAGNWANQSNGLPVSGSYTDMATGDLDSDGDMDLVFGDTNNGNVFTNDGVSPLSWTQENSPGPWYGVALGNVNSDSFPDIVAGTWSGVMVWTSNGKQTGSFVWTPDVTGLPNTGQYYGVALGDIDNDMDMDLVSANSAGSGVIAYTGNGGAGGSMVWSPAGNGLPTSGSYNDVKLGDVNNDGNLDIVATSPSGIYVWTGDGGSGGSCDWEANSTNLPTTYDYWGLALGDLNQDGDLDIIAANFSGGVGVWLGNGGVSGSMSWTSGSTGLPTTGQYIDVCVSDVNNDGQLDIGGAEAQNLGVHVWKNDFISEFSTLFVPIAGVVALFIIFAKRRKK